MHENRGPVSVFAGLVNQFQSWPRLTAIFLGGVAAAGFEPLSLWPIALLAMGAFGALISKAISFRQAAVLGWLFGVAHFTVSNTWIAGAFAFQEALPVWLGWLAVPVLSLLLGVFPALASAAAWRLNRGRGNWRFAALFAASWTIAEWLRSWVLTGFAWNPFSIVLLGDLDRTGAAILLPWVGTYALSGVAVFAGCAFLILINRKRFILAIAGAAVLTAAMLWPAGNLVDGTRAYTLVQPDFRQTNLHDPSSFEDQFRRIASLSIPLEPGQKRIVMWPESGIPDYLRDGYPQRYYVQTTAAGDPEYARRRIASVIGEESILLTGAVDLEIDGGRAAGARNAVTIIDDEGQILAGYAKAHLVPFGEYLPLRWLLEPIGLSRFVPGSIDFWPGNGPQTIDLGDMGLAAPQICYEIVFSGQITDRDDRPDYIFNPSNDGWYGSWGPPQHLAQARMRAIEEGLPVLRSTTTGISAIIDANGVVRQHLGAFQAGRLDGKIPPPHAPTLFARLGNYLPVGLAILIILIAVVAPWVRRG